jgi:DNA polymerase elongation subunit (family B)
MERFEGQFQIGWDWYERIYNKETKETKFRKIRAKPEYYLESSSKGEYKSFLDDRPLIRKIGRPPKELSTTENIYTKIPENFVNIRDNYWTENEDTKFQMNPRIWYFDIETTALGSGIDIENTPEEVVLLQIYDNKEKKMFLIGTRPWKCISEFNKETLKEKEGFNVVYKEVKDEFQLFNLFFNLIQKLKPLIVLGWNTNGFDYPYLFNRAKKLGFDTNNFSPFKKETKLRVVPGIMKSYELKSPGIFYIDYLELYKKYKFGPKPSLALDYVSEAELGKGKISHDMYSTFDGMRTGSSYIFPDKEPTDGFDKMMFDLQNEFKTNPTSELKEQIHNLANDLFVYYGAIDTYRVKEIDDKLQLSKILLMISSKMGVLISEAVGTVKPWASYIENFVWKDKKILPNDKSDSNSKVKGGYVSDPRRGRHKWIFSVDINSAYPLLGMCGFNISPETYISPRELPNDLREINALYFNNEDEHKRIDLYLNNPEVFKNYKELLEKYNYSGTCSGGIYTKDKKGIIPILVEKIYSERKKQKKSMLDWKQKASDAKNQEEKSHALYMAQQNNTGQLVSKVLVNALYGGLANVYFKLFNIEMARSITSQTRFYLLLLNHRINEYLQKIYPQEESYIVYNDTDSAYISLEPIIEKLKDKLPKEKQELTDWIDKFIKTKIDPVVEKTNKEFANIYNAYNGDVIKAEREVISDVSVFANKKSYFMRVIDNEGVRYQNENLDLKFIGIELAKSTIPVFFKTKLKESVNIILDSDIQEIKEWIQTVRDEVLSLPLDQITKTTGIGSLNYNLDIVEFKDGRKVAIPINSRAALAANKIIGTDKFKQRFNPVQVGDKVKILPLKEPNPVNQPVIAFNDVQFAEYFRKYVNYDSIFEKNFIAPLEIMIQSIDDWGQKLRTNTEQLDEW